MKSIRDLLAPLVLALALAPAPLLAQDGGETAPAQDAAAKAAEDKALLESITGEMMKKVEEIRGLKFKQDVERVWKSRDEARDEMIAEIEAEMPAEDLDAASKSMSFFGLAKEGIDLKAVFSDFISAGAGGYYIPKKKVFSLVRGFSIDGSRPIVFHELVHAVEDQYYDFDERTRRYQDEDRDDHNVALHALVEGSARMYENKFVDSEEGLREKYAKSSGEEAMKQMPKLMKLPPSLLIGTGIFPYGNGSRFLEAVLPKLVASTGEGAGTEVQALASIYADPPVSSEMILHPEKYREQPDYPRDVTLPDIAGALGEGWTTVVENTMGEFGTGLALNACLFPNIVPVQVQLILERPPPGEMPKEVVVFQGETAKAVTGWDGDRYRLYGHGKALCCAWASVWDTEPDAVEFADTYTAVLAKKYRSATREVPGEVDGWWTQTFTGTRDAVTTIARKGDLVLVAERIPADRVDSVMKALAKTTLHRDDRDTVPAK